MAALAAVAIIVVAFAAGYYAYRTRGQAGSDATYDAVAVVSSVAWLLTGVFLVLGGFVLLGGLMIVLFTWLALAKGEKTSDRARARLANR